MKIHPRLLRKQNLSSTGKTLFVLVVMLSLFGVLMVFSASKYMAQQTYGNEFYFLFKQLIGFVLGLAFMIVLKNVNHKSLSKFSVFALIVAYVLLALVFVPGIGVENYGAKRWIRLPGFTIQASEIAKFCFVLFASSHLASHRATIKNFKTLLPIVFAGGGMCLLIILEPNMSITMCMGLVMLAMLFVGGISFKHFLVFAIPALCLVPVLIIIEPYRMLRLLAFINPWASPKGEGYQLIQSYFSIANGGIFGVGLFNSRQKYLFLPFSESDFIFGIIAEEFGLVGCVLLVGVYVGIIFCLIKIAINSSNLFGCYLASGIACVVGIQTMLNFCVCLGLIPPTGLPLPFVSAGSTSLVVFMSAIGVALNVDKQSGMGKHFNTRHNTLSQKKFEKFSQNI